jgi:protein gp37
MIQDILTDEMLMKGRFWTDAWSLVQGCSPVSPGCVNCWLCRFQGMEPGQQVVTNGHFNGNVVERKDRLGIPLKARKPRVYAIWSDLGHKDISLQFILQAHSVMKQCPQHYFLIVTKRPERFTGMTLDPLPNVMILITMENQEMADKRGIFVISLANMGWQVGILAEPLLGPLDVSIYMQSTHSSRHDCDTGCIMPGAQWIITGPENGPGKRPFDPTWAISLRDQTKGAKIPFLYKAGQLKGKYYPGVPNL